MEYYSATKKENSIGLGGEIRQEEIFGGDESAPKLDCSNVSPVINLLKHINLYIYNK